jgi:transcriptional regulator with XRE-family HTH domain
MLKIGEVLRRLRKEKDLSLRAVGENIGIPFNTLSAYERNVVQPTIENCYKLSKFFEVPIEYFILEDSSKKEFHDVELLHLFHKADSLDAKDRRVVKNYIRKYLKTKADLDALQKESDSPDT